MSLKDRSQAYLKELLNLFKFLSRDPSVWSSHENIANSAGSIYEGIKNARRYPQRTSTIEISPNWEVPIKSSAVCSVNGRASLLIGGEILFSNGCLQRQALSAIITFSALNDGDPIIGQPRLKEGHTYVVRKLHYDFDGELLQNDRPVQHLQVGGNLNINHIYSQESVPNVFVEERFTQLDLPRIPYPVTDFATLLETLLKQFNHKEANFLNEPGWIERVCSMESIWLKHYYESALKQIAKTNRRTTLYSHHCMPITD